MYFLKKYKDRMMVTAVAIILIIIIGKTSSQRLDITKFEKTIGSLLTPISKVSFTVTSKISDVFNRISNFSNILEENETLKGKISELESENIELRDIIGRMDYLKAELELLENTGQNLVSAQIISKEPGNWYDRFVIDKGENHGVEVGATIVQGVKLEGDIIQEGIIGRVADVGPNWSKVVSVVDEANNTSFKIIRTQDGGIISGSTKNTLGGYLFDNKADVIVGDQLLTSGLGRKFVKDIYIGEVESVIIDEIDQSKQIVVKPAIDFKKLQKVFVIVD